MCNNSIFTIDLLQDTEACHNAMMALPKPDDSYVSYGKYLRTFGIGYIGDVDISQKAVHSSNHGTKCYFIYLLPADGAREYMDAGGLRRKLTVCPNSKHCKLACLAESGRAGLDIRSERYRIYRARLLKTKLFFERPDIFYYMVSYEIQHQHIKAMLAKFEFGARLNGTSDLDHSKYLFPDGKNIFERFNNVTFYDYTKVPSHLGLMDKYPNYKLTLSFNGYNESQCAEALEQGIGVAVVFKNGLPEKWMGKRVINGDLFDMRYFDRKFFGIPQNEGYIVGLKYKPVADDYKNGKYVEPTDNKFIVDAKTA